MLDFSFGELLLIVVVGVLFLRPKDVPVAARAVARFVAHVRALTNELRSAFDELAREAGVEDVKTDLKRITGEDGKQYETYNIDDFLPRKNKTGDDA